MRISDEGCKRRAMVVPFDSRVTDDSGEKDAAAHVYPCTPNIDAAWCASGSPLPGC